MTLGYRIGFAGMMVGVAVMVAGIGIFAAPSEGANEGANEDAKRIEWGVRLVVDVSIMFVAISRDSSRVCSSSSRLARSLRSLTSQSLLITSTLHLDAMCSAVPPFSLSTLKAMCFDLSSSSALRRSKKVESKLIRLVY